jgi:hypothetical protein
MFGLFKCKKPIFEIDSKLEDDSKEEELKEYTFEIKTDKEVYQVVLKDKLYKDMERSFVLLQNENHAYMYYLKCDKTEEFREKFQVKAKVDFLEPADIGHILSLPGSQGPYVLNYGTKNIMSIRKQDIISVKCIDVKKEKVMLKNYKVVPK